MMQQISVKIKNDLEEQLLGLVLSLDLQAFSNPLIRDLESGSEIDFELTGETVVTILVSDTEKDIDSIKESIKSWLKENSLSDSVLLIEEYPENQDWMLNFKEYFKPIKVGNSILITPPLESEYAEPESESEPRPTNIIVIDPGMAFGTGTHETTRLCLELIEKIDVAGQYFLDIGAGSGILSFYLIQKGAAGGTAIEIESAAVENLKKNAALNKMPSSLDVVCSSIDKFRCLQQVDGITANITTPVIIENIALFSKWVKDKSWGIFSGINTTNSILAKNAFRDNNWEIIEEKIDGDWHGYYCLKK